MTSYRKALILLLLIACVAQIPRYAQAKTGNHKIVNFGLILYNPMVERSQEILDWLEKTNFRKWNLICESQIAQNVTFAYGLLEYGEIVAFPTLSFRRGMPNPQDRIKSLQECYDSFDKIGIRPRGFFLFQPDTLMLNYAQDVLDMRYFTGYCFEQYAVDYMSMRGGWQLPYYHNHDHTLKPAKDNDGLVVYPHLTWDWISSLTVSHHLNTHPLDIICMYPTNTEVIQYAVKTIYRNLELQPFGYATVMFEYDWVKAYSEQRAPGLLDEFTNALLQEFGWCGRTYSQTTGLFRALYLKTPTYHFEYTSPYDDQTVEWYYDTNCRIARVGTEIRSYIEFDGQKDPFLKSSRISEQTPDIHTSKSNNSLRFNIDDLGGGEYRAPSRGNSVPYNGQLEDFPRFYKIYMRMAPFLQ